MRIGTKSVLFGAHQFGVHLDRRNVKPLQAALQAKANAEEAAINNSLRSREEAE